MFELRQSTTVTVNVGPFVDKADGVTTKTALTPTVYLSKNGGTYAARNSATATSHDRDGHYKVELNATDTNTLGRLRAEVTDTATHLPVWEDFLVISQEEYDTKYTAGLTFSHVKKNQALANFIFVMKDAITHAPVAGKTVTVTRAIDNGTFAAGTLSAVTEIASGLYRVDFAAADLNGKVILLRATASGCDDTLERIITDP